MPKVYNKLILIIGLVFLLNLASVPAHVQAQAPWPPFWFNVYPSYDDGKIVYSLTLYTRVDYSLADLTIKIPLPEGTRYLEGNTQPSATVNFDGQEVTFFTSAFHRQLAVASFTVEVVDPSRSTFTIRPWVKWEGDHPGDYLDDEVSIDIDRSSLEWQSPPKSRLLLEMSAEATDDQIIYLVHPKITDRRPILWDVKINVPVPEGTTFLSADASAPFVADYDGREVTFFATQLDRDANLEPLTLKVSTTGVTDPIVVTRAWATWKNVGRGVGQKLPAIEETVTGNVAVYPHAKQYVLADQMTDVPYAHYDITSVALQENGTSLNIVYYTAGELKEIDGENLTFNFFVDKDCNSETGNWVGAEQWLTYKHTEKRASLVNWDETKKEFTWSEAIKDIDIIVGLRGIILQTPEGFLLDNQQFCWVTEVQNHTKSPSPKLPRDTVPNNRRNLPRYEAASSSNEGSVGATKDISTVLEAAVNSDISITTVKSPFSVSSKTVPELDLEGKIAVPIDDGYGFYNVHVFSVSSGGQEIAQIPYARQPEFSADGNRLLFNKEGGAGPENIVEHNLIDGTQKIISDHNEDAYPSYNSEGDQVVYSNSHQVLGANGLYPPLMFVQCSLRRPNQEPEKRCQDILTFGVLVPAGQIGEIWGDHPLWTADDMIAYRGCDSWAGGSSCGIYTVGSWATKDISNGANPVQITTNLSDTPTDTAGDTIAFMSRNEGNWEVYTVDLNSRAIKNLSNSPDSDDGLPTISPDGNQVAFVSDRDGKWAVWVVSVVGGPAQKLFDLPDNDPWGDGDRAWQEERISWAP